MVKENFSSSILRKHTFFRVLAAFWACVGKSGFRLEGKSKQNERDLRLILDSTAEGIYVIDLEGKCTLCNASCLSMLGYSHEHQLLGKNMHDIIHNKHPDGTHYPEEQCRIFQAFKKGQGTHVEDEVFWREDGTCFPVEYFSYPQYRDGRVIGAVVTFMDITERKKAEEELKESERSKAVLLSNLPGMAYRCKYDRDWTMQFVSDGCYRLTGYHPESLLGNKEISYNALIQPEYREAIWEEWARVLAQKKAFKYEYPIKTASGEVKWVFEQGQGIYNEQEDIQALEGLIIDITDRKMKEEEVRYLSNHDYLTDLYNHRYFEEAKKRLDTGDNLPLSIIIGDINGVKLINDAFGHAVGDKLIARTAGIIKDCCREEDIVARTGGDEFCILLPKTDSDTALLVLEKIKTACEEYNNAINGEILRIDLSLGYSTKNTTDEKIELVVKAAEDYMYKRKLLEHRSFHSAILSSIRATMFEKSQETEEHAGRLIEMTRKVGMELNLTQTELDELELLATLHDIGKVGIEDRILNKAGRLTDEEWAEMRKHPEIGYRIAMSSLELVSIAEYILSHHERWDGKGYPQGLKGEEIPLPSRILAVADAYDAMTQDRPYRRAMSAEDAAAEIKKNAGSQFDPEIVRVFLEKVLQKQTP
ncbi:MAG: HD domain-containing phosphohydrolase [Clostridia bacterium]